MASLSTSSLPNSQTTRQLYRQGIYRIALINARSLIPNYSDICQLFQCGVTLLGITETWLDETIADGEICPSGISIVQHDRNRRGGGVALMLSDSAKFIPRPDLCSGCIETVWIELFPRSKRSMLVRCAYRPPSFSVNNFFDSLSSECDKGLLVGKKQNVVIIGDLNCDSLIPNSMSAKKLDSFCKDADLINLVHMPTRVTSTTSSQLNVLLTNWESCFRNMAILPFSASDHHIIEVELYVRGFKPFKPPKFIPIRRYRGFDVERVSQTLTSEDWKRCVSLEEIDDCVECFNTVVTKMVDLLIPETFKKVKHDVPPWCCSPKVQDTRRLCKRAHKEALRQTRKKHGSLFGKIGIRGIKC